MPFSCEIHRTPHYQDTTVAKNEKRDLEHSEKNSKPEVGIFLSDPWNNYSCNEKNKKSDLKILPEEMNGIRTCKHTLLRIIIFRYVFAYKLFTYFHFVEKWKFKSFFGCHAYKS